MCGLRFHHKKKILLDCSSSSRDQERLPCKVGFDASKNMITMISDKYCEVYYIFESRVTR